MIERKVNGCVVRMVRGDITDLEVEAFVFAARPNLALGTGWGGAIAVRGGPSIQEALDAIGSVAVGDAVVTDAGNMKAKHIIHAVVPVFQEADEDRKLKEATTAALRRADEKGIQQIAFPALGAGFYGLPVDLCAKVMLGAVKDYLKGKTSIREVLFCLADTREIGPFQKQIEALA